MPITLACLDMAGTTVRDDGLVTEAFLFALETLGVPRDDPGHPARLDHVRLTMGQPKLVVFRALLDDETAATRAVAAFDESVAAQVDAGRVAPLPGVEDAFATLRDAGVAVVLTTGFSAATQDLLVAHLGWSGLVDGWIAPGPAADGTVRRGRPHPDLVLAAALATQVDDVRRVAVVGDTANDLWSGHHAGAGLVAGVRTGSHGDAELASAPHTHLADDLPSLVPHLLDA